MIFGGLLGTAEGRAVWRACLAPRLSNVALAAFAAACKAGRDHRRGLVADGEKDVVRLWQRHVGPTPKELRVALAVGLPLVSS